jgi:hypothetical protein
MQTIASPGRQMFVEPKRREQSVHVEVCDFTGRLPFEGQPDERDQPFHDVRMAVRLKVHVAATRLRREPDLAETALHLVGFLP